MVFKAVLINSYFNISEYCIVPGQISQHVADKILRHIEIMNPIRHELNCPIYVSKNSGYRPGWYEIRKGRSGNSQHCYKGLGAADYTCEESMLHKLIIKLKASDYTRICYYPNDKFIHCDFASDSHLYFMDYGNGWKLQ